MIVALQKSKEEIIRELTIEKERLKDYLRNNDSVKDYTRLQTIVSDLQRLCRNNNNFMLLTTSVRKSVEELGYKVELNKATYSESLYLTCINPATNKIELKIRFSSHKIPGWLRGGWLPSIKTYDIRFGTEQQMRKQINLAIKKLGVCNGN